MQGDERNGWVLYTMRCAVAAGMVALAGLACACAERGQTEVPSCPPPGALDSLLAEIRRDSIAMVPPGAVDRASHDSVLLEPVTIPDSTLLPRIRVDEALPPSGLTTGYYRIGRVGETAYRLRGWECDNISEWIGAIQPFDASAAPSVWLSIFNLAVALNPVGDAAKLLDPSRSTEMDTTRILRSLDIDGSLHPELLKQEDGGWEGSVTVFWYSTRSRGVRAANWSFGFDEHGNLLSLQEKALGPTPSARVIVSN